MNCPSCGSENSADHRHCWNCGSKLEAACPRCGTTNPPDHRFCSNCGHKLSGVQPGSPERATPKEERRFITALFMDLVGFTPLSEANDPEEIRRLLTTYFDRSKAVIERFGGVVDKFTGDAVTAFWGAVTATENDAEVAVRAGLELIDTVTALGTELNMLGLAARVGVLSGEAAVGPGGNEKGLVVGDIVNTAARLQGVAEPGMVLVGESTQRLASRAISFESLGERALKGKSAPVPVWRAVRLIAELGGRRRQETLEGPFIGRQEELRLLKDQLAAVGREKRGRLISVVGEAGIGKSRLLWEFEKYIDGLAEDTYWHTGRSPSYGEGLTFWALGEMIRRRAGIAENDDDASTRSRLKATLTEFLMDGEERRWIEPRLLALLGLDPMPAGEREELFAALRIFFQRISEHGTTVLVFEDLQWADSGLLDFVLDLVDRSSTQPVLVITLARPELLERQPGWGGRRNQLSVHLGPLADAEMRELVNGLAPGMPGDGAELIAARAAGVPLYAVEMVRMLISSGILASEAGEYRLVGQLAEAPLPDTVQALIGARLDRLPADARAVLQEASVIGIVFSPRTLAELTGSDSIDDMLAKLVAADLITLEDDPRAPERGQYRFVQGLIREVAYGRLTRAERLSRHLAAASLYERLDDPELAPVVASHYMSAYRAGTGPDEELALRARTSLLEAAKRAGELHSDAQAHSLSMQALDLATDPAEQAAIKEQVARAASELGHFDEALTLGREVLDWRNEQGDRPAILRAAAALADTMCDGFHTNEALELIQPFAGEVEGEEGELEIVSVLSRASMLAGHDSQSIVYTDRALVLAESARDDARVIDLFVTRGSALYGLGRPREGRLVLEGALKMAEQAGLLKIYLRAANNLTVSLMYDDPRAALTISEAALERSERLPMHMALRQQIWVAEGRRMEGNFDEALKIADDVDVGEGFPVEAVWQETIRIYLALIQGRGEDLAAAEGLSASLLSLDDPQAAAAGHMILAEYHALVGAWDDSYTEAMQADAASFGGSDVAWAKWAAVAAIWMRDGERLAQVAERFSGVSAQGRMVDGYGLLAEAGRQAVAGNRDAASESFREILRVWEPVAWPFDLAIVRATFAVAVGQGDPAAADAARQAKEWIVERGAVRLLQAWGAGLPQTQAVSA